MIRNNMIVELDDKKVKTAFLKGLEKNINVVKNLYDEVFVNNKGICYNINSLLSKYQGRCICYTSLHEVLGVEDNELFLLKPMEVFKCIKAGKTGITSYEIRNNEFIMINSGVEFIIGEYIDNKEINIEYLEEMIDKKTDDTDVSHILENFKNGEFVDLNVGGCGMLLTHRLFPLFNKSTMLNVGIHSTCDETFYGVFTNTIEEKNKKDEVVFKAEVKYFYKFLHL